MSLKNKNTKRVLIWFSCGAASAIATKLALKKFNTDDWIIEVLYCDTKSEHPDNWRFLRDVENWLNIEVEILQSLQYKDTWDVFESTKYLNGAYGSICSTELKQKLRDYYSKSKDLHVFGYTIEEKNRLLAFKKNNPRFKIWCPLIDEELTHSDCLNLVKATGIELPAMYKLGYKNNNCIGCVKGGAGYWNKIRIDFPEIFDRMCKLERKLNRTVLAPWFYKVYLDELDPNLGRYSQENMVCGILCQDLVDEWKSNENSD